jgi:hypothetical protein
MPLERVEWLPGSSTQLKNVVKTVTEVIPCYFRYFKKKKRLFEGKKPSNFPLNKAITERNWQSASRKRSWKNPIQEGQKYYDYLNSNPDFKYQDVADRFGVSKGRVSQMIALIKKLPQEILNYFYMENNAENSNDFTERKLRPLTLLGSDEEKIETFNEIKKECS